MKKIGLVISVLTILVLLSGVALADCVRDCLLTYDTCLNLCKQTGKGDDSACTNHCQKGRNGCIKRCEANNNRSKNTTNKEILVISEINCVCAECNKKCGTGHETWCSSYQKPKANTPIAKDTVAQYSYVSASPAEEKRHDNASPRLAEGSQLCCYTYNKTAIVARCPQSKPYFNSQNGECYSTKSACKEALGGYDFCQLCTSCP